MPLNLLEVPLAGVVIDVVSGTLGMVLLVTGAGLTAAGFAGCVAFAMLVLAFDAVLG